MRIIGGRPPAATLARPRRRSPPADAVPPNEENDPFGATRMSFGEHLEELRSALWKAVLALAVGFGIGLLLGDNLVRRIQDPLVEGLTNLRRAQQQDRYEQQGAETPGDKALVDRELAPQTYEVNADALVALLAELGFRRDPAVEDALPDAVPLTLWKDLEGDPSTRPMGTKAETAFTVYIKASLVVGVILASPFIFYFLWSFVAAGLYPHEKRHVHVFMPMSIGLFLTGVALAFFVVFRFVLAFLFEFYDWMDIDPMPRIDEWLGFVLLLPIGFGLSFQLPLVMLFLERIGVVTVETYTGYWKGAVLVIAIISMLLTPSEPYSMILMAAPLTLLYFGGVALCRLMPRAKPAFDSP